MGCIRNRWTYFGIEIGLILIALAAAAAHLVAMNHAFIGHTRLFYASPLIIAVSVVFFELGKRIDAPKSYLVACCFWMPAIAMFFAGQEFHRDFPVEVLPPVFHSPMHLIAPAAAGAWLFGYYRHRWVPFLHMAVLALVFVAVRKVGSGDCTGEQVTIASYAVAVYLALVAVIKRNRTAGALAAVLQQVGLISIIGDSGRTGEMINSVFLCLDTFNNRSCNLPKSGSYRTGITDHRTDRRYCEIR